MWAAVDSRRVAGVYIASDSRVSWGASHHWDQGRKTFSCHSQPYIFGYWGDVLFPALALPVIIEQLDSALLVINPTRPFGAVGNALRRLWLDYPGAERRDSGVIVGHRQGSGMRSVFSLAVFTYEARTATWKRRSVEMPTRSAVLRLAGSGARAVRNATRLWDESTEAGTSRAVFGAFCESLASREDPASGGGPQLVGLHRIGPGKTFGISYRERAFLAGAEVGRQHPGNVGWFNALFERVGPDGVRLPTAKAHRRRQRPACAGEPEVAATRGKCW